MRLAKKPLTDLTAIVTACLCLDKERVTVFKKKRIAVLTVLAFYLAAVQGTASAAIIEVDENLNNNLVPTDFSLTTTNNSGLANGRLEAKAVNGSAALVYNNNTLLGNRRQIDISYRGHFGYSYWGTYTEVTFGGLPITLNHGVNPTKHPASNFAGISGEAVSTSPFNFSIFDYAITLVDGQANFTGTDIATNTLAFNLTHTNANIRLADINQISFRSHNTTGTEPVWLDDINMQFHTVPVPATPLLLGAGLLVWMGSGKRNARIAA
ncbi:MAG: hypothetical protein AB8B87_27645 [Granulosicoccus sp.]